MVLCLLFFDPEFRDFGIIMLLIFKMNHPNVLWPFILLFILHFVLSCQNASIDCANILATSGTEVLVLRWIFPACCWFPFRRVCRRLPGRQTQSFSDLVSCLRLRLMPIVVVQDYLGHNRMKDLDFEIGLNHYIYWNLNFFILIFFLSLLCSLFTISYLRHVFYSLHFPLSFFAILFILFSLCLSLTFLF